MYLAEFVIHLAKKNKTFDKFKNALEKKGAQFTVSFLQFYYLVIIGSIDC